MHYILTNTKNKSTQKYNKIEKKYVLLRNFRNTEHKVTKKLFKKIGFFNFLTNKQVEKFNNLSNSRYRYWYLLNLSRYYELPKRTRKYIHTCRYILNRVTLKKVNGRNWIYVSKLSDKTCSRYLADAPREGKYQKVIDTMKRWQWFLMNKLTKSTSQCIVDYVKMIDFNKTKELVLKFNKKYCEFVSNSGKNILKYTGLAG